MSPAATMQVPAGAPPRKPRAAGRRASTRATSLMPVFQAGAERDRCGAVEFTTVAQPAHGFGFVGERTRVETGDVRVDLAILDLAKARWLDVRDAQRPQAETQHVLDQSLPLGRGQLGADEFVAHE